MPVESGSFVSNLKNIETFLLISQKKFVEMFFFEDFIKIRILWQFVFFQNTLFHHPNIQST